MPDHEPRLVRFLVGSGSTEEYLAKLREEEQLAQAESSEPSECEDDDS